MREYGKVYSRIWESASFRALSEDGRTLALYLLTCQHGTIAGVFRAPDGYVCEDLQWSSERVAEGFRELFANGFANRCETTKWVWVTRYLVWNAPENPNQRKAAAKIVGSIPDACCWKQAFMRVCGRLIGLQTAENANPCGTVPEPLLNQEQEQEQEQEYPPPPRKRGADVHGFPPGFDAFWAAYPRKTAKPQAAKAFARLRPDERLLQAMLAAIEQQRASPQWAKDGGAYIPHPATWINGRRWEDELPGAAPVAADPFAGAL